MIVSSYFLKNILMFIKKSTAFKLLKAVLWYKIQMFTLSENRSVSELESFFAQKLNRHSLKFLQ